MNSKKKSIEKYCLRELMHHSTSDICTVIKRTMSNGLKYKTGIFYTENTNTEMADEDRDIKAGKHQSGVSSLERTKRDIRDPADPSAEIMQPEELGESTAQRPQDLWGIITYN